MNRLYDFFRAPGTVIAGVVLIILFIALILPAQSAKAREYTPDGAAFDTAFFTAPDEVYSKAELFSASGRSEYVKARWTFDLIFPLSYGFFCLTALAFTSRILFREKLKLLLIIPVIGVLFDFAENSFVTAVMYTVGNPSAVLAWGVSISTLLKWIFVSTGFAAAVIGLGTSGLVTIIRRYRQ